MKKRTRLLTMLLGLGLMLSACGFCAMPASAASDTLYERILTDVPTYDPYRSNDVGTQKTHYQIFESLFYQKQDGTLVPAVCTAYEFSDDNTAVIFTIREGVKFHNGDILTPEDVVFSLNTAIASSFTSRMTSMMKNAELLPDGRVALNLKYPFRPVLGCLASSNTAIVPKKVYEADPEEFARKPVGAGPYMLGAIRSGETIQLDAFPDYWRGEAAIKKVVSRIIPDNSTALIALEAGDLDIMQPSQDFSDRQAIMANPKLHYYEAEQPCFFMFGFNCESNLFKNVTLRRAIAAAINKEELIIGAVNGMGGPIEAAICTNVPQYPKDFAGIEYNPEKAKQLLAEAGYPKGLSFTVRVIAATNYTKPVEIIQARLKKIGVDMKIEAMERASWMDQVYAKGQYDATYYAHAITVLDADFCTYSFFHSSMANGRGGNFYNYKNPELDKLLDEARGSADEKERDALYRKVAEIVRDDAVTVPTYMTFRTMAAVKDLKGVYADPMSRYYIYNYSW